uniref:Peptidase S1 domain-containing protein n=1 Tax=Amphiprion ocellaris TaxID=80972 RepID=A0A3Q1BUZ3_AMPOC
MQEQMCCDGFTTMAFYKVICATTVLLILLLPESESQLDVCGLASLNTRIVGGQDAPPGFWPWQVSVNSVGGFQFCGGSLMNNQWVLSAAHCFSRVRSAIVYVGRQSQQGSNPNEVSRTVSQIIIHPNYDSSTLNNDIALLRLSSSVTFSTYIAPVCLAASDSTFHAGVNTWVTGWGTIASGVSNPFPQNLMEVQVPIVGGRQCNCSYGVGQITDNMLCAGLPEGGRDSCQGYSGSPLMCKEEGTWFQVAVLSVENNSIEDNSTEISLTPDNSTKIILTEDNSTRVRLTREFRANNLQVFTRVSHFQNFLTQTLGTLLSPASTNNTINITMTSNTTATTNTLATTDSTNTTNSTNSTYTSAAATISVTTGGAPVHSSSVFFFFHHFLLLALGLQLFS